MQDVSLPNDENFTVVIVVVISIISSVVIRIVTPVLSCFKNVKKMLIIHSLNLTSGSASGLSVILGLITYSTNVVVKCTEILNDFGYKFILIIINLIFVYKVNLSETTSHRT